MTVTIDAKGVMTLINDTEENDDWMKALPGYRKGEQRAHKIASRIHKGKKPPKVVKLNGS